MSVPSLELDANESLYRGLLRGLLYPLGHPSVEIGLRPADLINHVREVFDIDRDDHEYFVSEELQNRPQKFQVNVTLLEAKKTNISSKSKNTNKRRRAKLKRSSRSQDSHPAKISKTELGKTTHWTELDFNQFESLSQGQVEGEGQRNGGGKIVHTELFETSENKNGSVPPNISTYCLLTVCKPYRSRGSPRSSPKTSPKMSPKVSPKSSPKQSPKASPKNSPKYSPVLQNSSRYEEDVQRSQAVKGLLSSKWNEEFVLEVEDIVSDELHICLCDEEQAYSTDKQADKTNKLKSFFKSILNTSTDNECPIPGCIGRVVVPIRDIPNQGCDRWFDVFSFGSVSSRTKPVGQCQLKLALSYKQDVASMFTHEEYYQASMYVYKHADKCAKESDANEINLSTSSRRLLDIFAVSNRISKLSQNILDLTVLLELAETCENEVGKITDRVLHKMVEDVQMTWLSRHLVDKTLLEKMPLSDIEVSLFCKASKKYIKSLTDKVDNLPGLFPPSAESLMIVKGSLGVAIHLSELDIWNTSFNPQKELADQLLKKLQVDIELWLTEMLDSIKIHNKVKDSVIPRTEKLSEVIASFVSHCSPLGIIKQFYDMIGVNYYRVVAFNTDRKVTSITRALMIEMDKYQLRYHRFTVNITKSSRLTLSLYFSLRNLYKLIRDGLTDRDMFRLTISQYQSWFQNSLVFWIMTFKTECTSRMEKALEIDKDMVVVTSLVKFSNSSVDVLSCFAVIIEEWNRIGFNDPDSTIMGITKITDLICDGIRLYVEKIHCILERNCYYDSNEAQFDVTDRVCITLNNIEHVRKYLSELPEHLHWNDVTELMSVSHEDENIGKKSLVTLNRLISTTQQDILFKSSFLLQEIAFRMKVNIQKQMETFVLKAPEKVSSVDDTLEYLSTNLRTLQDRLSSTIYPNMVEHLWGVMLLLLEDNMMIGRPIEYYEYMQKHLHSLSSFFVNCGLPETKKHSFNYSDLVLRLDDNCLTTEKLMLQYFKDLADQPDTPTEYLGHLAVKVAFVEETREMVSIYIKVMQARDLPGLDPSGLSDPYVVVSLQPHSMFEAIKPQKTKVVEKTLQPVFNATFTFTGIPKEYLAIPGTTILLSVLDYDCITSDDFAGEVLVHLNSIAAITSKQDIDKVPVVIMPLKRPACKMERAFKVLQERCVWDKAAKTFVAARRNFIQNQPKRTDKPFKKKSTLTNVFAFFGINKNHTKNQE
ncbi:protein unc-13 homolog D-like [Gigantopelta aegis]|uniref:protein unc-13 homolog D-like n=1 Tax=Gigantopelta aegis TaxID=1735272 RepID=UPI001B88E6EB|nr:protein unc-13 homolog D-like [Gigantopelta aegis]